MVTQYNNLLYVTGNGIGLITLNRPKALNALNSELLTELNSLLDIIAQDQSVKVVIVTGSGDKSFVAGADIAEMHGLS
ncbi:MAG: Crotonyl-CoA hydratase, partial [Sporomusa sp.]|nr:Crotonyl-CoA hydratase [Sporomusa sp.]